MISRDLVARHPPAEELHLRSPVNWTVVLFFATLSGLHFSIAIPAFEHGRWEGYMSLIFAVLFAFAAIAGYFAKREMRISPARRRIIVCNGVWGLQFTRSIPFEDVHAIRLTHSGGAGRDARIEVLCDNEDVECPPTDIPRQQALLLALMMNVELIKVSDGLEDAPNRPDRQL